MRVHRVFLNSLTRGEAQLVGNEAHHLQKVLRVKLGDKIKVFNGQGLEASAEVLALENGKVTLKLEQAKVGETLEPLWSITLAVALLKGDKMSTVVRQGTELGVTKFIPFLAEYCDVRTLKNNKLRRWRSIAQEAAKQTGRSIVPTVSELNKLDSLELKTLNILAHPGSQQALQELTQNYSITKPLDILCVTGPEGGFSNSEVNMLKTKNFESVNLGPRLLKADTAPVTLVAAILLPIGQ